LPAHAPHGRRINAEQIDTFEPHPATRDRSPCWEESENGPKSQALATPGLSDKPDGFTVSDLKRDTVDGVGTTAIGSHRYGEILYFEQPSLLGWRLD
jgi:hypothetical protein